MARITQPEVLKKFVSEKKKQNLLSEFIGRVNTTLKLIFLKKKDIKPMSYREVSYNRDLSEQGVFKWMKEYNVGCAYLVKSFLR